jgi:long-chain acyl-CoA synthetase
MKAPILPSGATLPAAFFDAAQERAGAECLATKRRGVWVGMTWAEAAARVAELSAALVARGLAAGEVACIVAYPRAEALLTDLAVLAAGAASAAVSPHPGGDLAAACRDMGARWVFVQEAALLDRFRGADGSLPAAMTFVVLSGSERVIGAVALDELQRAGREWPDALAATRQRAKGLDASSPAFVEPGDERRPSSARTVTHLQALQACRASCGRVPYREGDAKLCFLPWSVGSERLLGLYLPMLAGARLRFAEGPDTVPEDLREVQPHVVTAHPRQLARLRSDVESATAEAGAVPRAAWQRAMAGGRAIAAARRTGKTPRWTLRLRDVLARAFVMNSVRRSLGLDHCRMIVALGAELPDDDRQWFEALGVPVARLDPVTDLQDMAPSEAHPAALPARTRPLYT